MSFNTNKNDNVMGIDIGTSRVRVYVKSKGIVYNEPCCCAVRRSDGKSLVFGSAARAFEGKAGSEVYILDIVKDSRLAYRDKAKELIGLIIANFKTLFYHGPRILCAVASDLSDVDLKTLEEIFFECGATSLKLVNSALACALANGISPRQQKGAFFADIGAGSVTSAVIASGQVASSNTVNCAGNVMTEAVIDYIAKKCAVRIGKQEAEKIKCRAAGARNITIGKNMHNLLPGVVEIYSDEIILASEPAMFRITECLRETLRKTAPELCADIYDSGVMLCGGASLMPGLGTYISGALKLPVHISKKGDISAIEGVGRLIESNLFDTI